MGRRVVGAGAAALLMLGAAACGGGGSAKASRSSTTTTAARITGPTAPSEGGSTTTTAGGRASTPTTAAGKAATATTATTASTATTAPASTTSTSAAPTTTRRGATVQVGAADNGKTVTLHVGDTLEVVLTACQDCGYSWYMTGKPNPAVFTYEGEQSATPSTTSTTAGEPPVVGQPVTDTWTFKAVGAHTTGFIAGYFPPGQSTPSQTFQVRLTVTA